MPRLSVGTLVQPESFTSIKGELIQLPDGRSEFTHVQFRRFAGCPVCNFHLHTMAKRQNELESQGIRQLVFFHSSAEEMLKYQAQLPFDCIADPQMQHYKKWGVEQSWWAIAHLKVAISGMRGFLATGKLYKKAENGIRGLPADFLLDAEGRILSVHYGSHADDQWSVEHLLALTQRLKAQQVAQ